MRRLAHCTALLLASAALAFPVAALAQSGTGDNQYSDPFAGQGNGSQGSGGGGGGGGNQNSGSGGGNQNSGSGGGNQSSGGGGGGSSQGTGAGSGSSTQQLASGTTESQAAQTTTPAGQLPRTGAEPGLVALLGVGLIFAGAGIRVRLRRPLG